MHYLKSEHNARNKEMSKRITVKANSAVSNKICNKKAPISMFCITVYIIILQILWKLTRVSKIKKSLKKTKHMCLFSIMLTQWWYLNSQGQGSLFSVSSTNQYPKHFKICALLIYFIQQKYLEANFQKCIPTSSTSFYCCMQLFVRFLQQY